MERDEVEELREGQRQHREVDAAAAQREEADEGAPQQRETDAGAERQPQRADLQLGQRDAGAVRAEAPVGGVAEGEQSRVAVEQVEAEGQQPVDQHLGGQRLVGHDERKDPEDDEEGEHRMPAATAPSRLPMPPTTTTTNDSITIVMPISG